MVFQKKKKNERRNKIGLSEQVYIYMNRKYCKKKKEERSKRRVKTISELYQR